MEVEVILGQVGEHGRGDVHAGGALELQRVRGDLHRARDVARVEHLAERALEVERLGRRPHDRAILPAHDRLDRPEQAAAQARALQQRPREERRRGLAVGAGDAGDPQRRRRIAVEARRGDRHRLAHVGRPRPRARRAPAAAARPARRRPRATASGAKSCPSRVKPGTQKNRVPAATSRLSKVRPVTTTSGPSPSSSRSVMRPPVYERARRRECLVCPSSEISITRNAAR